MFFVFACVLINDFYFEDIFCKLAFYCRKLLLIKMNVGLCVF